MVESGARARRQARGERPLGLFSWLRQCYHCAVLSKFLLIVHKLNRKTVLSFKPLHVFDKDVSGVIKYCTAAAHRRGAGAIGGGGSNCGAEASGLRIFHDPILLLLLFSKFYIYYVKLSE